MNQATLLTNQRTSTAMAVRDVMLVLLLALAVRLITLNGAFGTDDVVYFDRAAQIARGEWTSANYNGALRYGFNIPAAGFMALFGHSIFVASLWPLTCSLIEIGAVLLFAAKVVSRRAGVVAGLLLATAPLHIAVSTRISADPVVAMFVTVGFVLLYFGAAQRRSGLLFAAGCAIGGIFWTKELAAVTWFAFLPMLWFFRGQWRNTLFVVAGGVLMMLLHGLMMWAIAGDPLHLLKVVLSAVQHNFIDGGQGEDSAGYYLRYLFFDLRHTGLLAFFAVASMLVVSRSIKPDTQVRTALIYVLIWWIGLLLVLSVFPVSLSPLRFPMKQANYITLFLAPTALLAGVVIAALPRKLSQLAFFACAGVGLVLGALQQADYRAFTANSKAVATFATTNPLSVIVGSTNNSALGPLWAAQSNPDVSHAKIITFRELSEQDPLALQHVAAAEKIYVVLDRQSMNWGTGNMAITSALPCWRPLQTLVPEDLGVGNKLAKAVSVALQSIGPVSNALDRLATPKKADVYEIDGSDVFCRGH